MDKENWVGSTGGSERPEVEGASSSSSSAAISLRRPSADGSSNKRLKRERRTLPPSCVRPRFRGRVGDVVDAIDSVGKWCEAVILDIKERHRFARRRCEGPLVALVHFLYWDKKYDVWLRASPRVYP